MSRPEKDKVREERIIMEIVVDAYGEEERVMGWYYYLDDVVTFPFDAECIVERKASPLRKGEKVKVIEQSPMDDCMKEMFVQIEWQGREMGVPLAQLKPIGVDPQTQEAVEDWHYWVNMGYEF
ncbi:MAG: calcium-binding protein [Chloroflexota bacterium]